MGELQDGLPDVAATYCRKSRLRRKVGPRWASGICCIRPAGKAGLYKHRLLQRNRPAQRLQNVLDDVIVDRLVAQLPQPIDRLDKRLVGPQAAVLPGGDVDAQLLLGKIARPDLVGVGAGLDADAELQPAFRSRAIVTDGS